MRILLADDHEFMRDLIKEFITQQDPACHIEEVDNGADAVDKALAEEYDIILMDISMPKLDGISATEQILGKKPHNKVISISMNNKQDEIVRLKKAGAKAHLLKEDIDQTLWPAIENVLQGVILFPVE